ncbi:MAG: hypothetical protein ABL999_05440 [Pyrinomonadaceae bacterium]
MKDSTRFVICINNADYPASLERWKVYRVVPDEKAESRSLIRVVDESEEDYLYSAKDFVAIILPSNVESAMLALQ